MATGDNILTAATVAKKCGIIQNSSSIIIDLCGDGEALKFEYFDHERTTTISIKPDDWNSDTDEQDPEAQLLSNRKSKSVKNCNKSIRHSGNSEQQIIELTAEEVLNW